MQKLTLSVDAAIVSRAKTFASKRGTSVSRLVERYLDAVSSPAEPASAELPPVTRRLVGALRGKKTGPAASRAHLEHKYR